MCKLKSPSTTISIGKRLRSVRNEFISSRKSFVLSPLAGEGGGR